jgi:hypothetical protein
MRPFIVACAVAAALATGAAVVLDQLQKSAATAYSTSGARV